MRNHRDFKASSLFKSSRNFFGLHETFLDFRRFQRTFKTLQDFKAEVSAVTPLPYYGSSFVADWLVMFTKGKLKVKFSKIIDALCNGILIEGEELGFIYESRRLIEEIDSIKKKNIEKLQKCCARLYTKPCFLFKIVNKTLRDNDQSKLQTLGPFCYLLYNYIGTQRNEYLSIRNQLKQNF
jgi:hypothetical protein